MNQFLSLVRGRLERQRDQALLARLRDDTGHLAEVAAARLLLRKCNLVGAWARVAGRPRVENRGRIEVGSRTRLVCDFAPVELSTGHDGTIRIGARCAINFGTVLRAAKSVTLGERVSIGPYCIISDTDQGEPGAREVAADPVVIGDGVWLASRVTVLPGARIGEGVVVTAGSVVGGEIPARVIVGGNPARILRRLDGSAPAPAADPAVLPRHSNGTSSGEHLDGGGLKSDAAGSATQARPAPAHRGFLISDFTIDELGRRLELDLSAPVLDATIAPFGQVVSTLLSPKSPDHDYAVVWTRPEGVVPSFARLLEFEQVDDETLRGEVDRFASLLLDGLKSYRFAFVPTWTVPPWHRGLGLADGRANGLMRALCAMNQQLMARLQDCPNIFVLNAQRWCDEAERGAYSTKLWYMGKVPFHSSVFEHAAGDVKGAIQGLTGMTRKLVVVDLDDTLWGGIVGDVGWEHLRLGGHDSIGESFVDFQRALKSLKRRGILLAVVSKNDESVALEAIRNHSAMVLKEDDFVGWRINWQDKARNVADLVASLNLGLQSTVFIDDNPFERTRVREALPEVFVPEWPEDKLSYTSTLLSLRCFDTPVRTAEDAARTEMYVSDRKREDLRAQVGSLDEWLLSLGLRVQVEPLSASNLARTTQLLNKTNQLNLTTRRLTEPELLDWVKADGHWLRTISVSDRLGDAGLTGILSLEADGNVCRVVDFVLSCRVMGRRVEEAMIHLAVDAARSMSLERVVANLVPTKKNGPCREFFQRSGLQREGETRFTWDARQEYSLSAVISLERVA